MSFKLLKFTKLHIDFPILVSRGHSDKRALSRTLGAPGMGARHKNKKNQENYLPAAGGMMRQEQRVELMQVTNYAFIQLTPASDIMGNHQPAEIRRIATGEAARGAGETAEALHASSGLCLYNGGKSQAGSCSKANRVSLLGRVKTEAPRAKGHQGQDTKGNAEGGWHCRLHSAM